MKNFINIPSGIKRLIVTFSGGKDSVLTVLKVLDRYREDSVGVTVLHADTEVDPPPLRKAVAKSFSVFRELGKKLGVSIDTVVVKPRPQHRFFYLLLGKGYPPPSHRFRWCTDKLKVIPVRDYLRQLPDPESVLVLSGLRADESRERRKRASAGLPGTVRGTRIPIRYPILGLSAEEVWREIERYERKFGIMGAFDHLRELYSCNGGFSSLRTGCWVCTVVRRDRSLEKLAEKNERLRGLLWYRQLLLKVRDTDKTRAVNGNRRPLKVEVRKSLLLKLLRVWDLPEERIRQIQNQWEIEAWTW